MTGLEVGQVVKVALPGRRPFESKILAIRQTELAVDLKAPNGGLRTVRVECVEPLRPACEECGDEIPKGRRRASCAACGRLVCSWCFHHAGHTSEKTRV